MKGKAGRSQGCPPFAGLRVEQVAGQSPRHTKEIVLRGLAYRTRVARTHLDGAGMSLQSQKPESRKRASKGLILLGPEEEEQAPKVGEAAVVSEGGRGPKHPAQETKGRENFRECDGSDETTATSHL